MGKNLRERERERIEVKGEESGCRIKRVPEY